MATGGFIEGMAQGTSASNPRTSASTKHHEGRSVWVLTAYGISGLALFGVLAYYISSYIAH